MAVFYELQQFGPDITVAVLNGQLNLGNRLMEFEHTIKQRIREGSRKMIFLLGGLTYIDSAGLGMVATCAGAMAEAGGRLVVVSAGGKIRHMFETTRLDRVIDFYSDFDSACQSFSKPPQSPKESAS
jgi:anti-anti-sigma factor